MNEGNNDLILKKKFMKQIKIVSKYITIKKKQVIIDSIIQSTDRRIQERNDRQQRSKS